MRKLFMVSLLLLCAYVMRAQQKLAGKVFDETGKPVSGASVVIKGSRSGTTTDNDGSFTISASSGATLVVSAVGYTESQSKYTGGNSITLTIQTDSKTLADVVVTGVSQATSKAKLAFSLTKVDVKQINTVPATDLSQTLRGKVAGIQISQTQGDDGASVFLRGAKSMFGNISPLIVIDGFVTNFTLTDLNPQDVESIEVVKGAAASALYGTRAEGGVIQVVSKKGKNARGGVEITVDNEVGRNDIQRTPELATMHYYKTDPNDTYGFQYASGSTSARVANYQANGFSVILSPYKNNYDNTNALLSNKIYYSNYVSVATAGEKYNAFLSFRNQHTGGIIDPIDPNKKRSISFRSQFRPTPKLEAEISFNYFNEKKPSAAATGDNQGTLFAATLQWEPFIDLSAKNARGDYNVVPLGANIQGANLANPLYEWSKREYTNNTDNYLGGARLRYKILSNLSAEVLGSVRKETYSTSNMYPMGFETTTSNDQLNNGYLALS
ncbi:MAG: TonB-dependent receptor plug domain-containing protein, partial [Chitinophagaceae bacterium]|nr:TonB-dependent receptor plug domain-containing protein [Chitinophagaceae bacterium]